MIDVVDYDKDITEDDNVDKVASAQPGFVKDLVWRLTKLETSKILSKQGIVEPLRYSDVKRPTTGSCARKINRDLEKRKESSFCNIGILFCL